MKRYRENGYKIVIITNQAGIARGLYTEDDMRRFHRLMNKRLAECGAKADAFYYCPYHPDFTGECDCRKPKPGMIKKALFDFETRPSDCVMYGDNEKDDKP